MSHSMGLPMHSRFGGGHSSPPPIRISQKTIREPQKQQNKAPPSILANSSVNSNTSPSASAPLIDALKICASQDAARFHFPGHNKGRAAPASLSRIIGLKPFVHDLPELPELDDLFSPKGPILDAQRRASELFGSSETWFLVGGTTCGIQASIMATCSPGDSLILPRNSHVSAISAMVLCGAVPKYITPSYNAEWDIACGIRASQVEEAIEGLERAHRRAAAVLITSPTYHGICSDVGEIARLCHSRRIPIIVDEAHGAHFKFHRDFPPTALEQGADIAVQSTHKVLCSLTQSSMLHMNGDLVDRERICRCLQTLQSSSPSYLLLASLDAARAQISDSADSIFNECVELAARMKIQIETIPNVALLNLSSDPLRVTVGVDGLGLSGYEADEMLCESKGVVCELAGTRSLTFAVNLGTSKEDCERLVSGLKHLSLNLFRKHGLKRVGVDAPFEDVCVKLSPREAFFARKKKVSIEDSIGEICGELICPYPPGIPVLIPGEAINESALNYLLDVRDRGAAISGAADPMLSSVVVCDV
ncbi:hypothetical protein QJS04_geneDACA020756 [Acorus gramineus]|uniref:Arginine decarboxylase n=1 Tax=Acorus gramineus TaxID=55184 RepID=A0AAV9A5V0_ACOGR|nr:hypothetical protein QJS04_geneDACA020756 [Acorus gramineus]